MPIHDVAELVDEADELGRPVGTIVLGIKNGQEAGNGALGAGEHRAMNQPVETSDHSDGEIGAGAAGKLDDRLIVRQLAQVAVQENGLLVGIGVAAFAGIFLRFATVVPPFRTDVELIAALFGLLWPAYQYFLLVYCGTTPGLGLAGLGVRRFDGGPVPRKLRRWRVLASFLSAISLGLGYAWCFLDEDQLSWHDRITRTHLADERSKHPAEN